jgi:hypothetical protein
MPEFTRPTIVAAGRTIDGWGHSRIDGFFLEHDLAGSIASGSIETRANNLIRYLIDNPAATTPEGDNLVDTVVRDLVERAARVALGGLDFIELFPKLARALKRDTFFVQDGRLCRALPDLVLIVARLLLRRLADRVSV